MTAFTVPSTRAAADRIGTTRWNTDVVNNLTAIGEAWSTYTPALTGSSVNPTLGSGSVQEGHYKLWGKICVVRVGIQFGTSGTAAGTGNYIISLPADPITSAMSRTYLGSGILSTAGASLTALHPFRSGSGLVQMVKTGTATQVGAADGGVSVGLYLQITFEVA